MNLTCLFLGHKPNRQSLTVADEKGPIKVNQYVPMVFNSRVDAGFSVYPCLRCRVLMAVVNEGPPVLATLHERTFKGESD